MSVGIVGGCGVEVVGAEELDEEWGGSADGLEGLEVRCESSQGFWF